MSFSVAARSKAWVCGRSLAGTAGSNFEKSEVSVVFCQVVSASGRSLFQRSRVCVCVCVCVWSECDCED
jgi:hypothetical protein